MVAPVLPSWTTKDEKKYQGLLRRVEKYLRKERAAYVRKYGAEDAEKARQAAIARVNKNRSGSAA
jgi:ribulose bisphosphate carboxylase small subunit